MLNIYQHATGYQGTQDATKSAFPQLQGHVETRRPSRSKVTTHQAGGKKQIFFLPDPAVFTPIYLCDNALDAISTVRESFQESFLLLLLFEYSWDRS